ncbi:heterokaryon incompatibility protein-domain-containing protein [Xylaria flabelliformis]|nr:heterokaryon incompatibility protein-domain-containing protein [Xylaria flabelliformis]
MRLINTQSLNLEEFVGSAIPEYAILSHTWGGEEVTFQEWQDGSSVIEKKAGYKKILAACERARADDLGYLWVDTTCIDKTSSAELSEAINSMFAWYADSHRCYVYLADFAWNMGSFEFLNTAQLSQCRWFKRGWTLQELLAPETLLFFDMFWREFGNRGDGRFRFQLSEITGIKTMYLEFRPWIAQASVSERMSWVAHRETTREEDIAYCLLGIFGINMSLIYGEGRRAFLRLQEEIIRVSNDQTIFCWTYPTEEDLVDEDWDSVLAPHPRVFSMSGKYLSDPEHSTGYSLTNNGLEITLPAIRLDQHYFIALLAVKMKEDRVAIVLERNGNLERRTFRERLRHIPPQIHQDASSSTVSTTI